MIDKLPDGLIYQSDDSEGKYNSTTGCWSIGDLAFNETVTLVIKTLINVTDDSIVNIASVNSSTYDPNPENNNVSNETVVISGADLGIYKFVSNATVRNGDVVYWNVTVTNYGPQTAVNVVVTDTIPLGLIEVTVVNVTVGKFENGVWSGFNLSSGDSATLVLSTKISMTNTTIVNCVNVTSDTPDPNPDNNNASNKTVVIPEADLVISKSVSNPSAHKGDLINWIITVTNIGPDTAINPIVSDILPDGLVYVSDDSKGTYDSIAGIWYLPNLSSHQTATLVITTLVDTTNETIINVANVSSKTYDPNETNNKCNNSTVVPPEVDLVLTIDANVTKVTVGDNIEFTVTVVNQGPDTAIKTRAYVDLPDELKLLGFVPSNGTYDPETGIWIIGDLAPGDKVTLLLYTNASVSGEFVVEAITECDVYESDYTNNYDFTTVEVTGLEPPVPDLDVPEPSDIPEPLMPAAGNPFVMVILALLAIVGISLKRKNN